MKMIQKSVLVAILILANSAYATQSLPDSFQGKWLPDFVPVQDSRLYCDRDSEYMLSDSLNATMAEFEKYEMMPDYQTITISNQGIKWQFYESTATVKVVKYTKYQSNQIAFVGKGVSIEQDGKSHFQESYHYKIANDKLYIDDLPIRYRRCPEYHD